MSTHPVREEIPVLYTYCHLLHAGSATTNSAWRRASRHRATLRYFLSVPKPDFLPHYTHCLDNLFRYGGCIPAIHAKADMADTLLLGLQWFWEGGGCWSGRAAGSRTCPT